MYVCRRKIMNVCIVQVFFCASKQVCKCVNICDLDYRSLQLCKNPDKTLLWSKREHKENLSVPLINLSCLLCNYSAGIQNKKQARTYQIPNLGSNTDHSWAEAQYYIGGRHRTAKTYTGRWTPHIPFDCGNNWVGGDTKHTF